MSSVLPQRAAEFEAEVENCLVDARGLVRSAMDMRSRAPFQPGDFQGCNTHEYPGRSWDDFADYIGYENVGMCSGAYLSAMLCKYDATGDEQALALARRTFRGICWLYELSQAVEEGFYCKCYGGRLSHEISSDQYIYTLNALDSFIPHATPQEADQCRRMITQMVRFWMRKRYAYPYFGQPLQWPLARFPGFAWLAWVHSGEVEFREEFERLCSLPAVTERLPYGELTWDEVLADARSRPPAFPFEVAGAPRLIRLNPETTESGFVSLLPLLKHDAPHRQLWLRKVEAMYERDHRWIADDGNAMGAALYEPATGRIQEVRQLLHLPTHDHWRYFGFVGWIRSAMHAAMFARAAVGIEAWLPECGGREMARHILEKLSGDRLFWFVDMDGQQFPDELAWMRNVYSGDAVTHWLWSWWQLQTC